jgi:HlyD family secretion protein
VQSPDEGSIDRIVVAENQFVKQGQAVAYLDNQKLQNNQSRLEGEIQQAKLQLVLADAQVRSLDNQIAAESSAISRSVAVAQAELRASKRSYQERQVSTQADLDEALASYQLAVDERDRFQKLANEGAISQIRVTEKEAAVKIAQAKVNRIKASLNPTDASVVRAEEVVAQERAKGVAALANLRRQREQQLQSRAGILLQIQSNQKSLKQLKSDIAGTIVRAPISGTVLQLNLRNKGQVVQQGQAIAQIAPQNAPVLIKARIGSQDINKVEKGQAVQMRVSACPYPEYGTLKGRVIAVSPDAIPAETKSGEGEASAASSQAAYEVTIKPQTPFVGTKAHSCRLQFGMQGQADIISKEDTVLQFVLKKARFLADI